MIGGADLLALPAEPLAEVTSVVSFEVTESIEVKLEVIEVYVDDALCDAVVDVCPTQQCSQLGFVMH
jgi:hypothetical protein